MSEDLAAGNELLENDESFKEMMALFNEKTYFQRLKGMFEGLKKPKDTKEYKLARIVMQRQATPAAAITIPVILVALLALLAKGKEKTEGAFETEIMEAEEIQEQLGEIPQDMPEPQPMDDIMPNDVQFTPEMALDIAALQMMVYYRYLPTFKQVDVPKEVVTEPQGKGDIVVDTDL